jgi:phytanoyl-CoA dioxygenase PhyH
MQGMDAWLAGAQTRATWAELCPELAIEQSAPAAPLLHVDDAARAELWNALLNDGWFQLPPTLPAAITAPMAAAVQNIVSRCIPAVFAFVFDEFWHLSAYIEELLAAVLGPDFRVLPDFWAWCIQPHRGEKGWRPHRDKGYETLRDNGLPKSLSIWIPLTDANADNGCMYVLPACRDPNYRARRSSTTVESVQEVRALPAAAGSILGWNQALLHWGGRANERAASPRVSFSIEYQRGDEPPLNQPLLDPRRAPPFERRLGLIGKQILQYRHMVDLGDELTVVAARLKERWLG